jgi:hypothetical protein
MPNGREIEEVWSDVVQVWVTNSKTYSKGNGGM